MLNAQAQRQTGALAGFGGVSRISAAFKGKAQRISQPFARFDVNLGQTFGQALAIGIAEVFDGDPLGQTVACGHVC